MLSGTQRFDDLFQTVAHAFFLQQIRAVENTRQLAAQSFGSGHIDAILVGPISHAAGRGHLLAVLAFDQPANIHLSEFVEPFFHAKAVHQRVQRGGGCFAQIQFPRQ